MYKIHADLQTDIFKENYNSKINYICETCSIKRPSNDIEIHNHYFFSHEKYYILTEYKDHWNKLSFITDSVEDNFKLRTYGSEFDNFYILPFGSETIQSTGLTGKNKLSTLKYLDEHENEIYEINTNLTKLFIITNGMLDPISLQNPIGIINTIPRYRCSKEDFEQNVQIPVKYKNIIEKLDDKLEFYKQKSMIPYETPVLNKLNLEEILL